MSAEGAQFADVLERIGHGVLSELEDLPDEVLNRPVQIPEGNTLFAVATHLVGAGVIFGNVKLVRSRHVA